VSRRARTCASVLLPEPFGPMIECTSPAFTFRSMPLRISWLSTLTCRFLISSKLIPFPLGSQAVATLCTGSRPYPTLPSRLTPSSLCLQSALPQVKELVFADLRGGSLVFHAGGGVPHLDVRESVGTALVADQKRVALRVVASPRSALHDLHLASIGVLAVAGRDALCDDGAARVLADVDHLGASVGLLVIIGEGNRVELAHRVLTLQDAARILP